MAEKAPGVRAVLGPGTGPLTDEPAYQGAPVAAVAADTDEQARAAMRLIEVEWEQLEPLLDPDEAVRRNELVEEPNHDERGDIERGLAEADVVVEAEYRTQSVLHNSMETHQSVCQWEGDDHLTVYISTQFVWGVRERVAKHFGLPADHVRVVCRFMGGGFGSKNGPGDYTFVGAELARQTGRPVKAALTRREENLDAGNRNATIQRLRIGARTDGTLTVLDGEFVNSTGWDGWLASTGGPMRMLYACENVRTVEYAAKLNTPPMLAFRAPGFVEGTFGLECLMDELAAELDLDPLELRRRNYAQHDAMDERPFSSKNLLECYKRAEPHWERREAVRRSSDGTWKRGVGLASQVWYGGGGPPSYAWVRVGADARVTVVTAMQDIGTGSATAMAQIAAEELGLPIDHVEVSLGDTARGPYATISAGSSTIPSMGPAVRSAAADAARQIIEIAAQRHDREQRSLSLKGGRIVCSDGGSWPLEEVTCLLGVRADPRPGLAWPESGRHADSDLRSSGRRGRRRRRDWRGACRQDRRDPRRRPRHQPARCLEPGRGRDHPGAWPYPLRGAAIDPATGTILTQTLDAYKLPTIADVPEIVTDLVDEPDTHLTNLGSKGLGEPPIIPTAAAIANAIRDATGADVRSLPISREEMLRALREASEREQVGASAT